MLPSSHSSISQTFVFNSNKSSLKPFFHSIVRTIYRDNCLTLSEEFHLSAVALFPQKNILWFLKQKPCLHNQWLTQQMHISTPPAGLKTLPGPIIFTLRTMCPLFVYLEVSTDSAVSQPCCQQAVNFLGQQVCLEDGCLHLLQKGICDYSYSLLAPHGTLTLIYK